MSKKPSRHPQAMTPAQMMRQRALELVMDNYNAFSEPEKAVFAADTLADFMISGALPTEGRASCTGTDDI